MRSVKIDSHNLGWLPAMSALAGLILGCSSINQSEIHSVRRIVGFDVADIECDNRGKVQKIKFTEAVVVPDVTTRKWIAFASGQLDGRQELVSRSMLDELSNFEKVSSLSFVGIHASPPTSWSALGTLGISRLDLGASNIDDSSSAFLSRLEKLEFLDLSGTACGDATIASIANLPSLRHLRVNGTNVSNEGLQSIRHNSQLKTIEVSDSGVTKRGIAAYTKSGGNAKVTIAVPIGGVL